MDCNYNSTDQLAAHVQRYCRDNGLIGSGDGDVCFCLRHYEFLTMDDSFRSVR